MIPTDLVAEDGQDVAPQYLPDGRIIFASTRQRLSKAILLDEGRPQYAALDEDRRAPAFQIHIMNADGSGIDQLSFNLSHDLAPQVLNDGQLLYSRWDNYANRNGINLYRMRPDGLESQIRYGWHSHQQGSDGARNEYLQLTQAQDGTLMMLLRDRHSSSYGGDLVSLDIANFSDAEQAVADGNGSVAQRSLSYGEIRSDDQLSAGGRINSFWPMFDGTGRLLLSWSPCQVQIGSGDEMRTEPCVGYQDSDDPAIVAAEPLYGIWMYDPAAQTQIPVVLAVAGNMQVEPVIMQPRARPDYIADAVAGVELDADLVDAGAGVLNIRSVYDIDGVDTAPAGIAALADPAQTTAAERPIRFIRLYRGVPMPPRELVNLPGTAFGRSSAQLMRELIGYAPVEPDGSVRLKIPANIPLSLSLLDANGQRIGGRHQQWFSVRPGEQLQCRGCHTADSTAPHGRPDAEASSAHLGAPATGLAYPNTEPALFADEGETMAEVASRIRGLQSPDRDLHFIDIWTDPALRSKDPELNLSYADLITPAPQGAACFDNWVSFCRLAIHYPEHIQPLWTLDRQVFDVVSNELLRDDTCISCHAPSDADGLAQVPAAQLDLSATISSDEPDHLTSYRELLFADNEQEVVEGALRDRLVQATDADGNPLFQTDGEGELILDELGNPIPLMVNVAVTPPLSVAGAQASPRLFERFSASGSHAGRLSPAELRLLAEWLDLGGQYYNTPFYSNEN